MLNTIKRIISRIPKKGIATLASPFLAVIADRAYDWYVLETQFVGWPRVLPVLMWSGVFLAAYFLLAFVYQSVKLVRELEGRARSVPVEAYHREMTLLAYNNKKPLPSDRVSIGTFQDRLLAVDIMAKVILEEKARPGVEVFLKRITLGRPYCPNCSRTLDTTHAGWHADGVQIGYSCTQCKTERRGDQDAVHKDVEGEVRRNYDCFWQAYQNEIAKMTGAKPEDFKRA